MHAMWQNINEANHFHQLLLNIIEKNNSEMESNTKIINLEEIKNHQLLKKCQNATEAYLSQVKSKAIF